jgi:hypothetical protein
MTTASADDPIQASDTQQLLQGFYFVFLTQNGNKLMLTPTGGPFKGAAAVVFVAVQDQIRDDGGAMEHWVLSDQYARAQPGDGIAGGLRLVPWQFEFDAGIGSFAGFKATFGALPGITYIRAACSPPARAIP